MFEEFLSSTKDKYSIISEKALIILLQYLTLYLCKLGFFKHKNIKIKKVIFLGIGKEMRVALSLICSSINWIIKNKQCQIPY